MFASEPVLHVSAGVIVTAPDTSADAPVIGSPAADVTLMMMAVGNAHGGCTHSGEEQRLATRAIIITTQTSAVRDRVTMRHLTAVGRAKLEDLLMFL
jgi:hypothetical protein